MQNILNRIPHKKFITTLLILFGLMLIIVPLVLFILLKSGSLQKTTASIPDQTTIAVLDGQAIKKEDLVKVAQEQYTPSSVDNQAIKDALDTLVERKILDKEAKAKNISISQDEINKKATRDDIDANQAYYEVLKDKVIMLEVNSRKALTIGFWSPPASDYNNLSADEQKAITTELKDGLLALKEIQTGLQANQDPIFLTDSILIKYPSLKPVLALNGYIYSKLTTTDEKINAILPQIYEFGASNSDKSVIAGLFSMKLNEVRTFSNTQTNQGGDVFKLLEIGNANGALSYDSWLTLQKTNLKETYPL